MRDTIKQLASDRKRDRFPLHLARVLREVRDQETWRRWGYKSFGAYIAGDMGWPRSHAYHLINVLNVCERLFDERTLNDLCGAVGYAKMVDLLPIITPENRDYLIYKATVLNQRQLRVYVREAKMTLGLRKIA